MTFIPLTALDQLPTTGDYAIFKDSTCPISSRVRRTISTYLTAHDLPVYHLHVVDQRPLSNQITDTYGIKHESPQILVFKDGKTVANESHLQITKEWLEGNIG